VRVLDAERARVAAAEERDHVGRGPEAPVGEAERRGGHGGQVGLGDPVELGRQLARARRFGA
jgi:hypothetical protein